MYRRLMSVVCGLLLSFNAFAESPTPAPSPGVAPSILSLSVGYEHSCVVFKGGGVKCWGKNDFRQLGIMDLFNRGDAAGEMGANLPLVRLPRPAKSVSAGRIHNCAILDNDTVRCWGWYGSFTGLFDGINGTQPVPLGTGRTVKMVSLGYVHSCALLDNNTIKCWGENNHGQLGQGHTRAIGNVASDMGDNLPAINLGTGRTAKAIYAGDYFNCAILDNDSVKCWGINNSAQLGSAGLGASRGTHPSSMGDGMAAVNLGTGRTAKSMALGFNFACALMDNNQVRCWGANHNGQIGAGLPSTGTSEFIGDLIGEMGDRLISVDFGTGRTVKSLSSTASSGHVCAILDNDSLKCWGLNQSGQLGIGNESSKGKDPHELGNFLPAVDLGSGRAPFKAKSVGLGVEHSCTLLDNNTIKCWGNNDAGQLGLGDDRDRGDEPNEMGNNLPKVILY